MYYYKQPPRKRTREYFMPFFMIIFLIVIIVFGWRTFNAMLINDNKNTTNERVFLDIESGSVKAMAADSNEWNSVPDKIYLYRGEKAKTGSDGRAVLTFFNDSVIRMNKESEIHLKTLKKKKDIDTIEAFLPDGNFWVEVKGLNNPDSSFKLTTEMFDIVSRDSVFAMSSPNTVYMIEGDAQINVKNEDEIIKTYTLGIGQQFMIDSEGIEKLTINQDLDVIFAISDTFKQSDWYRWNMGLDGKEVVVSNEEEETPGKETVENEEAVKEKEAAPVDPSDLLPPTVPQITAPGINGETVTLDNIEVNIKGTVSEDTYTVIINDYQLQLYEPGSKEFRYVAKTTYDNLKPGENKYKIYAKDHNGNISEPAEITLILTQEVIDTNPLEKEPSDTEESSVGGVVITAPNNGQDFLTSETQIDISGAVPEGTAKVMINDYALSKFKVGDLTWTYKAYKSLGSLAIGKKNTYTVKAYDTESNLLGSASIIIDVESQGMPEITIPTTRNSYLTNLDELVIGGTVGKWVQAVYVNDKKLVNYIPGSEKWHYTVVLQPGENTFRVYGRLDGIDTESDEIKITYQP